MTRDESRRPLKVQVKSGRGRTLSSKLWLDRQLNDPYVARARREGFRSRAAYNLIEIDDKQSLLRLGHPRGHPARGTARWGLGGAKTGRVPQRLGAWRARPGLRLH